MVHAIASDYSSNLENSPGAEEKTDSGREQHQLMLCSQFFSLPTAILIMLEAISSTVTGLGSLPGCLFLRSDLSSGDESVASH